MNVLVFLGVDIVKVTSRDILRHTSVDVLVLNTYLSIKAKCTRG